VTKNNKNKIKKVIKSIDKVFCYGKVESSSTVTEEVMKTAIIEWTAVIITGIAFGTLFAYGLLGGF